MKLIAFSDSHGDHMPMIQALRKHRNAEVVIFCGDGHNDIREVQKSFPDKMYLTVKGNCDWCCEFANVQTITLCGKKLLITHGHIQRVKESMMQLTYFGNQENADIVVFGHTHQQVTFLESKMILMNPGSIGYNEQYSTIDIDEKTGKITVNEFPHNKYGTFTVV